jgi:polysaccharide biosynthesis transport protein
VGDVEREQLCNQPNQALAVAMPDPTQLEEFNPQKYWLVLKRRWPVLLLTFGSCLAVSGAIAYSRKPIYEAQGQLLVQANRTPSLTGVGEKIGSLESLKREGNPMDTQAVVIQSLPMIQKVIENLQLKDRQGKPLHPDDLTLKVESIVGTDVIKITYASDHPQVATDVVNQLMRNYIDSNIENNRTEAVSAGSFIEQQLPQAKAEMERATEMLRQFRDQNHIVELDKESGATIDMLKNLTDQTNQSQAQLAELSAQQSAIADQVGPNPQTAIASASLSQLPAVQSALTELQKAESQLAIERTRYRPEHPNVALLQRQVDALQSVLNQRVNDVDGRATHPGSIPPGELEMSPLRQNLVSSYVQLQTQRQGLTQKIGALQEMQTAFKRRADAIPSLNKTQDDLVQKVLLAKKTYETLKTRLGDVRIAESQTVGNARIIQPAILPNKASSKTQQLILLGGGGLGLMLGLAAAIWADLIDRTLKSAQEAQTLFGYSLLGMIPRFKVAEGWDRLNSSSGILASGILASGISARVTVAQGPRSIVHEAYRMLQANLKFTNLDKKVQTIVITSSLPGEGKSEVAANLAATLAQSGKRVLLIDADMRSPSQHHLWGMVNSIGLSNLIVDPEEMADVLQPVMQNLTVITAGVMPPDPISLLESESMRQILQQVSQRYEYILFDSPPLVGMADAAMLGKLSSGVLLVARPGVVTYSSAAAAQDLLHRSGANVLGLVANGVNLKQEPDNFFYYSRALTRPEAAKAIVR